MSPELAGGTATALLVFDGDCGFCTSVARWAEKHFRRGERTAPWQLVGEEGLASLGLSVEDVKRAAWWVDASGTRERAHRAVGRALGASSGWWRLFGWLSLTPPTSLLASAVYALVVRYRYRLPGGTPACRLDGDGSDQGSTS